MMSSVLTWPTYTRYRDHPIEGGSGSGRIRDLAARER